MHGVVEPSTGDGIRDALLALKMARAGCQVREDIKEASISQLGLLALGNGVADRTKLRAIEGLRKWIELDHTILRTLLQLDDAAPEKLNIDVEVDVTIEARQATEIAREQMNDPDFIAWKRSKLTAPIDHGTNAEATNGHASTNGNGKPTP